MGKPSIFSSDYNNRMKRRRRRVVVVLVVLFFFVCITYLSGNIKGFISKEVASIKNLKLNSFIKKDNINKTATNINQENKTTSNLKNNTPTSSKEIEEKGVQVTLSDGTSVKAIYEVKDGKNKFKYISPLDAPLTFSVSPSGTAMVILENSSQNMIYVTTDGKINKVNDTKYVSMAGDTFTKELTMKSRSGYVWCSSPKFIDDNFVAYISEVPWFDDRTTKYIWVFNINDSNIKDRNDHRLYEQLAGEKLSLGNLTDKGLEVILDNSTKYIKYNGQSIQISD